MAAEERASGITPEETDLDDAIDSIMERKEGAEEKIARRAEQYNDDGEGKGDC